MHIVVIGAGPAGLCAARHITATSGSMTCVVYEQTDVLGGTWYYTDAVGTDKYGLPIHTSMYKNLRTNLPKETMEYLDYPIRSDKSYPTREEIYKYLQNYAEFFKLKQYIKFHHYVNHITPTDSGWEVTAVNLETNQTVVTAFDAVMICTGHYSYPHIPDIPGIKEFKGRILHSHDYRLPEQFSKQTVLVIGGGPSGCDTVLDMAEFTDKIYFSHHMDFLHKNDFPANICQKPDVKCITKHGAIFQDDTSCDDVDVILLCTGYNFNFPFLFKKCGITLEHGRFVRPLYKHMIHIHRPTFCFIGLPLVAPNPVFDYQVQYFLKLLSDKKHLPSVEKMLLDTENDIKERSSDGLDPRNYHLLLGKRLKPYIDTMSSLAELPPLQPVIYKLFDHSYKSLMESVSTYTNIV